MNKKERKEYAELQKLQEETEQSSEQRLDADMEQRKAYISDELYPTDMFMYKKMRIIPEAQTDFSGLIDKDVVLGNLGGQKPNIEELKFVAETIDVFKKVFVVEKTVPVLDEEGEHKFEEEINEETGEKNKVYLYTIRKVFNQDFDAIASMLLAGYKFQITSSRAMGEDREAKLDRMTGLQKEIRKRKVEGKKNIWGTGGGD